MLARLGNSLRGRWENFWSAEPCLAVHLVEAEDRFDKLIYTITNGVQDHLVERAHHWPGALSLGRNLTGIPMEISRPRRFFRDEDHGGTMPDTVTLRVERPDGFEHLTDDEWAKRITDAVDEVEAKARAERAETGRRILGRKAILRAAPTDRPSTVEPRRNLRPHVACKNEPVRRAALRALMAFRCAYHAARELFVGGDHQVMFPFGTWGFKLLGACCATAPP